MSKFLYILSGVLFVLGSIGLVITTGGTGAVTYTIPQTLSILAMVSPMFIFMGNFIYSIFKK